MSNPDFDPNATLYPPGHTAESPAEALPPILVAVYGSLRSDMGNHPVMLGAGGQLVAKGRTAEPLALRVSRRGLPTLGKTPATSRVAVEVYAVDAKGLAGLDRLEGHPDWYVREEIEILVDDNPAGERLRAWIYFMPPANQHPNTDGEVVTSGDYSDHPAAWRRR